MKLAGGILIILLLSFIFEYAILNIDTTRSPVPYPTNGMTMEQISDLASKNAIRYSNELQEQNKGKLELVKITSLFHLC